MPELFTIITYLSIYVGLIATTFYILSFRAYKKKEKMFFSDKELPFVSVIIPAYNEEKSIAGTIESILQTDYPKNKFEVIVVDDGSKDKTYKIALKYKKKGIRVFTKKNEGKGSALNLGISKSRGEIILTMDADTFVDPKSVRNMINYFKNEKVMAVTPTMLVHNPRSLWQKIQYMEYYLGVFLRKALATLGSVYVTPGALSAYKKKFFEKYGGYDVGNLTEDFEISLRIQSKGYIIENSEESPVYTIVPKTFRALLIQRRRWYRGYISNLWNYRKILGKKYGDLGLFVIPIAIISVVFAVIITLNLFFKILNKAVNEVLFLTNLGFDFSGFFEINLRIIERFFFLLFTNPIFLFVLLFLFIMKIYISWTKRRVGSNPGIIFNLYLFFVFFAVLFAFWWIVSIIYTLFNKKVAWR